MSDRADLTRERILDAAQKLFLEKGFDGTSMSALGNAAGVNQSLISHHFGNKQKLYDTTFSRLHDQYFQMQAERMEPKGQNGHGIELFEDSVKAWLSFLSEHPDATRLEAWNWLSGHDAAHPMIRTVIETGFERLKLGQKVGILRDDVPAKLIWALFISIGYGWEIVKETNSEVLGDDVNDDLFSKTALDILLDGVRGPNG
ncbi:MAG: TetR/AcrR family transcriptional regulator [Deltaproteobacteria bacterium]|nr:TetR/AcrR family transcriptional regulator [Deltaproteobacteria bacterium]